MNKTLLIIENDLELRKRHHDYVLDFKNKYVGEVIELTNFRCKTKEEIVGVVSKATDIAVQTCFVNGSDNQFFEMVGLLSKFKDGKNVYIYLMGEDLKEFIDRNLEDKELWSISQHKIYSMSPDDEQFTPHVLLDFSEQVNRHSEVLRLAEEKRLYDEQYEKSGKERPTGRKIKIIACVGFGEKFNNLPIGEVVDELDMSEIDPNSKRGVWIWGNGCPIKLINDIGITEYEVCEKMESGDLLIEISKAIYFDLDSLSRLELNGIIHVIEDEEETSNSIANFICEELEIPKRENRALIRTLIEKNRAK